jgi:hypothetical protein
MPSSSLGDLPFSSVAQPSQSSSSGVAGPFGLIGGSLRFHFVEKIAQALLLKTLNSLHGVIPATLAVSLQKADRVGHAKFRAEGLLAQLRELVKGRFFNGHFRFFQ